MAGVLAWGTWLWLRKTYVGKALRASAEDADIAAAYGVDHRKLAYLLSGIGAAYAGVAGGLMAQTTQFVALDVLAFNRSAELLLILVLSALRVLRELSLAV